MLYPRGLRKGGGGGVDSPMKEARMLAVSLRVENSDFGLA